jgi:hypothetical protein
MSKNDARLTWHRLKNINGWESKLLNEGLSGKEKLNDAETEVALDLLKKQAGIK